jgi:hypothetical protein
MVKFTSKAYNKIFIGIIITLVIVILVLGLLYFQEKQSISQVVYQNKNTNSSYQYEYDPKAARYHDEKVLYDQLYPPTNRTETPVYNAMDREVKNRNMYVPTQGKGDDYRMVGYLVNQEGNDSGGNNWKLFARQKTSNTADFYMVPANNNYDIKIPISNDIIVGNEKLRDVYTIPNEIQFNTPMLSKDSYQFIELPKTDLTDPRYV